MVHRVDQFVGARLRDFRTARGLSQSELAAQIGISFQQLQKYERATNRISSSRLWEICRELDTPVADFFPDFHTREANEQSVGATKGDNIIPLSGSVESSLIGVGLDEVQPEELAPQHVIRIARKIALIQDKRVRTQILLLIDACSRDLSLESVE